MAFVLFDSREVDDYVNLLWDEMDEDKRPKDPWNPLCKELWDEAWEEVECNRQCMLDELLSGIGEFDEILLVDRKVIRPKDFNDYLDSFDYEIVTPKYVFEHLWHIQVFQEDDEIWLRKFYDDGMYIMSEMAMRLVPDQPDLEAGSREFDDWLQWLKAANLKEFQWRHNLREGIDKYTVSLSPVFKDVIEGEHIIRC